MNWKEELQDKIQLVDKRLDELLPKETAYPQILSQAMRYSVFAGGKRLRPVLLLAACQAAGGTINDCLDFACAIEMIHTYSLIHDDLPAMDNDDYRRGRLTSHKVFGEDMAILAGDGLLHYAFQVMADEVCKKGTKAAEAMKVIADCAGTKGMLSGQVVDVQSEGKKIDEETLLYIHHNKTAAMIAAALKAGAILAGNQEAAEQFFTAGDHIGLAFQIQDDILDVVGSAKELGKPVHSDEKNEKNTYVSMYGLEKSHEMVEQFSSQAVEIFRTYQDKGQFLIHLTEYLIKRKN